MLSLFRDVFLSLSKITTHANAEEDDSESERKRDLEVTRRMLARRLSFRPSVEELKMQSIIKFNDYVEVTVPPSYDRKLDSKPWMLLSPQDKAVIRQELNQFKHDEMPVHEDSKKYTRYHRP